MSSATSIEPDVRVNADSAPDGQSSGKRETQAHDTFRPWHFFLLLSLVAATIAVILARQSRPEHLVLLSLMIGAAGFAAATLYRTLVPLVSDEPPSADVPLTGGLRAGLEREKMLVLRSIKELEFDRAMGKVSSKDFDEMAGRLRTRAMSLMRQLDSSSAYRELIERELSARLSQPASARIVQAEASGTPAGIPGACVCGTNNDEDAAFCKRCGTMLAPSRSS